ncbi:MAG: hypothetical protein IJE12_09755 [Prevotella sp.]|nr:hypothetical protein [Prevotella sp.]
MPFIEFQPILSVNDIANFCACTIETYDTDFFYTVIRRCILFYSHLCSSIYT